MKAPCPKTLSTTTWVVGLGGNLGDVRSSFTQAIRALERQAQVICLSNAYWTEPVGGPESQPRYLNAALLLQSSLAPLELLGLLLGVEAAAGRVRRERWGPRTLDLDLLFAPGVIVEDPALSVPHGSLHERAFALVPLLELIPDAIDPRSGSPLAELPVLATRPPMTQAGWPDGICWKWQGVLDPANALEDFSGTASQSPLAR
jgi:2-amino-4-hydroxy-6-hydroxymethyldihydropteridine diphosphokinase